MRKTTAEAMQELNAEVRKLWEMILSAFRRNST